MYIGSIFTKRWGRYSALKRIFKNKDGGSDVRVRIPSTIVQIRVEHSYMSTVVPVSTDISEAPNKAL